MNNYDGRKLGFVDIGITATLIYIGEESKNIWQIQGRKLRLIKEKRKAVRKENPEVITKKKTPDKINIDKKSKNYELGKRTEN